MKVRSGMKTMLVTPSSVEGFLRAPSLQVALHLVRWIILFRPSVATEHRRFTLMLLQVYIKYMLLKVVLAYFNPLWPLLNSAAAHGWISIFAD